MSPIARVVCVASAVSCPNGHLNSGCHRKSPYVGRFSVLLNLYRGCGALSVSVAPSSRTHFFSARMRLEGFHRVHGRSESSSSDLWLLSNLVCLIAFIRMTILSKQSFEVFEFFNVQFVSTLTADSLATEDLQPQDRGSAAVSSKTCLPANLVTIFIIALRSSPSGWRAN